MNRPSRTLPKRSKSRLFTREGAEAGEEARMLSADEKRELILAHAAARSSKPTSWGIGYYIGITASCLVVVTGWWLTLGTNLRSHLGGPTETDRQLQERIQQIRDGLHDSATPPSDELSAVSQDMTKREQAGEAAFRRAVADKTAAYLQSSSTTHTTSVR